MSRKGIEKHPDKNPRKIGEIQKITHLGEFYQSSKICPERGLSSWTGPGSAGGKWKLETQEKWQRDYSDINDNNGNDNNNYDDINGRDDNMNYDDNVSNTWNYETVPVG